MNDTSDAMPSGGYLLPLFPPTVFPRPVMAQAVFSALDTVLDAARQQNDALARAHGVRGASGSDLDALGALLSVPRLANESDAAYAVRLPATAAHGVAASTGPKMESYLQAALGVPVQVLDGPFGSASFLVNVIGNAPLLSQTSALVRSVKPLGTIFSVSALISGPGRGARVGDARVGDVLVGGNSGYITIA